MQTQDNGSVGLRVVEGNLFLFACFAEGGAEPDGLASGEHDAARAIGEEQLGGFLRTLRRHDQHVHRVGSGVQCRAVCPDH